MNKAVPRGLYTAFITMCVPSEPHMLTRDKDIICQRVSTGEMLKICALLALGSQPSTAPLSDWYHFWFKLKLAL